MVERPDSGGEWRMVVSGHPRENLMKTAFSGVGKAFLAAAFIVASATPAFGQATRTWVSGVGDDVNPCSRTAPCKTFAGAISKTASGGEISVLDPGGYGAVTITKSITISGDGTLAGVLNAGVNGIVVNCTVETNCRVTIRSISINGGYVTSTTNPQGVNGIRFLQGGQLHVENVTINNNSGHAIDFEPSGNSDLFVRDVAMRDNTSGAVLVKPQASGTATATLDRVVMDNNGRGLRVEDRGLARVRDSRATGNAANGFVALSVGGDNVGLTLENCSSLDNGATGIHSGGANAGVYLSNTTVMGNYDGVVMAGGSVYSLTGNRITGNINSNVPVGGLTGTISPI